MNRQSQIVNLQFPGLVAAAAFGWIALGALPLGSPLFFVAVAIAAAAYAVALWRLPKARVSGRALAVAALLTVAMRVPMAIVPLGAGSDMFRYVWDARVQRAGLSPYRAVPSDPALAYLHTAETRKMNNVNITSPYPPGAQLFFRLSTSIVESARAIKLVLIVCDLATALLLFVWLRSAGRNPLLALAYAWNPLVVLEAAHSGHLDAAGMFMAALAAYALTRRRIAMSVIALAAGIAIKFLPIVLIPLWWGRARLKHALLGAAFIAALYLVFIDLSGSAPVGSVTNMIRGFRFNGPVFKTLAFAIGPWGATAAGVVVGLGCAVLVRRSRIADDPAAFAWPMAAALVCSPVVYPWYLLWLTPFFVSRVAWPLMLWSIAILPVYTAWHGAMSGGTWALPAWMAFAEYALLFGTSVWLWMREGGGLQLAHPMALDQEVHGEQ